MKKQISYNTQFLGDLEVQNQNPQNNSKKAANTAYVDTAVTSVQSQVDEIGPELISGTHGTTATATWTGTSTRLTELKTGTFILYQSTSAGKTNVTLNLTLKDGTTTTGAKYVYFKDGTRLSTQYPAYCKILLVYNAASNSGVGAWWVVNPYTDTNTNTIGEYGGVNIVADTTGIGAYCLAMQRPNGTWASLVTTWGETATKTRNTNGFIVGSQIYISNKSTTVGSGSKLDASFVCCSRSMRYSTNCGTSLILGDPFYIVGTINEQDGLFYLAETWWTQTEPTTEDNKVYIFIGIAYSNYQVNVEPYHEWKQYYNGGFRTIEEIARMKADATLREKTEIEFASACPNNKIMYDDYGNPSVMVYIPPFKLSDVIPGAADTQIGDFWVGKYQASLIGNVAVSLPNKDPKTNMTYAQAKAYCEGKGEGWHLMTREEWADIELWCLANNIYPKGNGQYGKSFSAVTPEGVPTSIDSNTNLTGRIATGTGPLSYSHNGEPSGIWDMAGNVREILDGVRIFYGEVQVLDGSTWKAINAADGTLITPAGDGNTSGSVKTDFYSSNMVYSTTITQRVASVTCWTKNITADSTIGAAATTLLQRLCLLPISSYASQQQGLTVLWNNNSSNPINIDAGGKYSDNNIGVPLNRVGIDSYDFIQQGGSVALRTGFRIAYKQPTRGSVLPMSGGDDDIPQQNDQR